MSDGTLTMAKLREARRLLASLGPPPPRIDHIECAPSMVADLRARVDPVPPIPALGFRGISIAPNSMFPIEMACEHCHGSGGDEAFCRPCKGQGASLIIGVARGSESRLIAGMLPVKFSPHWPRSVPVPRRRLAGDVR